MPRSITPLEVAVVGAGMAGLSCARHLADTGMDVHVFDKARGVGGRMATRRMDEMGFDHGAQYFTAHSAAFTQQVEAWQQAGVVAAWQGRIAATDLQQIQPVEPQSRYVGVPRMSAVGRHLLGVLPFYPDHRLVECQFDGQYWHLQFDTQPSVLAKSLVLALPAPQVVDLLEIDHPLYADAVLQDMLPCWALMLHVAEPIAVDFEGCFVNAGILGWVARNSSKPDRAAAEAWVIHANHAWSQAQVDADPIWVQQQLYTAFCQLVQQPVHVEQQSVHRWLYALAAKALHVGCWYEPAQQFGIVGDWLAGSRIEGAWQSGQQLADRMIQNPAIAVTKK
ncbi:MAG: FAD-dependent oxidoreductase [Pseudomonadota bacterium]|nr:FAD-dependent oxidoreductase [Pseudomonadota bacterium]